MKPTANVARHLDPVEVIHTGRDGFALRCGQAPSQRVPLGTLTLPDS